MGKVLLVEDNKTAVKRIEQFISNIDGTLSVVACSEAGVAYTVAQREQIDIFILDIQLSDYKGTSLAKQVRSLPQYRYTPIIFESALAGEELWAYRDVKCYGFLIKPYTEEEFRAVFCEAMGLSAKLNKEEKRIQIQQKQFVFEYAVCDIAYMESFGKRVVIHTNLAGSGEKEDRISGYTLGRLLELVDSPSFVQCHKSYLVNKNYILQIDKTAGLIYLNGFQKPIPVGNKYQSEIWG